MKEQNHMTTDEELQADLMLLKELYPTFTKCELLEAKENLDRYFDLAVKIFLRLEKEEVEQKIESEKI